MNALGIYFGPQLISIVETKGKKPVNNIQIPQAMISSAELLEEKVPEEVKAATLLKEELKKNKIEAKEVNASLSGRDLIVRTFEMPLIPKEELFSNAINFEARKYIPFKIEDLVSDFQWTFDKALQRTRVLFVGIKKEALDKYINILSQSGLKIKTIEYAAFSVLRLLKLSDIKEKGVIAIIGIDSLKDDETNFMVLENGFPLFSRDITLTGEYEAPAKDAEATSAVVLEKLKREIHVSLDYYKRKFPEKNIGKIFLIANPHSQPELEGLAKDLGLEIRFIDLDKYIGKPVCPSLAFIKGYSTSLSDISIALKINLLLAKERAARKITAKEAAKALLITKLKPYLKTIAASLLLWIAVFFFGKYRLLPFKKELEEIIARRPQVSTVSPEASEKELTKLYSEYKGKISRLDNLINKQLYFTSLLDAIPRLAPDGMWLVNLSFENKREESKAELVLEGMAYLGDSNKEFALVNDFLAKLKDAPVFVKYFSEIRVISLDRKPVKKEAATHFIISCRNYKGAE